MLRFAKIIRSVSGPASSPQAHHLPSSVVQECGKDQAASSVAVYGDGESEFADAWEGGASGQVNDDGPLQEPLPAAKRRKQTRLSFVQRQSLDAARRNGALHHGPPERYANRTARLSPSVTSAAGSSRTPTSPSFLCQCVTTLKAMDARLITARRTAHEREVAADIGSKTGAQPVCDSAHPSARRLPGIAAEVLRQRFFQRRARRC